MSMPALRLSKANKFVWDRLKIDTLSSGTRPASRWLPKAALALIVLATAGCSILGGQHEAVTIYAPDPQVAGDPSWPQATWQLGVAPTTAARFVDSYRIAVRPTPGEVQVYKDARWFKAPSEQVEDTVLHALEDSGKIAAGRQESGIAANYKLLMDLRRFEADYAGQATPTATIEVNAKLLHSIHQDVVEARTFRQSIPVDGTDTEQVAQAFGKALGAISHDIAGWVLVTGNTHEAQGAHPTNH